MPTTFAPRLAPITLALVWAFIAGSGTEAQTQPAVGTQNELGTERHLQEVMKSTYCASCHPDIYAEHAQNTHGRAFTDEEVRLATGRFSQSDCIICHTPRPVFETGIGQNPIRRHFDLEEGNTCMTCHWKEGQDYSGFQGGPECTTAFDDRVGTVEACASCHRNHGTPYQWELAPKGKLAGKKCIDCHMAEVFRPVAVGEEPSPVRSHVFPASRNEAHLRKAYAYEARIDGNEVVVRITNRGAGHNFPTELKQRSVESLVVVRDASGAEVARSRMVFRDPYKRPYGLTLPVNTQIPSGESREHRVPIQVSDGTVECELHYKLYYPIEDHHPDLARRLEVRHLPFARIEPSTKSVESEPEVRVTTPDGIAPETASPADLVDYAHPAIDAVEVEIPQGTSEADVARLIELFQFPVPQANGEARKQLTAIGLPAVPALVRAMGSWDNKTWNQAMAVLLAIGADARPAIADALSSDELYVRLHACELLARMGWKEDGGKVLGALRANLERPNALDRSHAATTLGRLHLDESAPELRALLEDSDPDVVRAAAQALAALDDHEALPAIRSALERFEWAETKRDLGECLARLGDAGGVSVLLDGLDHPDDLVRESYFEAFFRVTGKHLCFEPLAPRDERLEKLGLLRAWWAEEGGPERLVHPYHVPYKDRNEAVKLVEAMGGGDGLTPAGDDEKIRARLLELEDAAVQVLAYVALKYPPGFAQKRALACSILGDLKSTDAVPALVAALRDPVVSVSAWACDSLARIGDQEALPALQRWHQRLLSLAARHAVPASAGPIDLLLAQAAGARLRLGDERGIPDLVALLLSPNADARRAAYEALYQRFGEELQYDPDASEAERRGAVELWQASR